MTGPRLSEYRRAVVAFPFITPKERGAKGDGVEMPDGVENEGTDDTAAFKRALADLEARGFGTLYIPKGRYMIDLPGLDQLLYDASNISIVGAPGAVLDFSRTDGFYNGLAGMDGVVRPSGFIATAGTKHDGTTPDAYISLTADTIAHPANVSVARITAGSRSGSTITQTTDVAHPLAVGDLIWVSGEPAITGTDVDDDEDAIVNSQMCFFTVNGRSMGRTIPVAVTRVDTNEYDFEYAGSLSGLDTVMDLSAASYVYYASDVISVADTSIFRRHERLLIGSLDERGRDNEHCNIGEFQLVATILNDTLLRLHGSVRDSYTVAASARVYKLSQIDNPVFDNVTFVGKGHNIATVNDDGVAQRGDVCLSLTHTNGLRLLNCKFYDCDLMSAQILHGSDILVEGNRIYQDQRDAGGALSGVIDIQYGINYGGVIDDILFWRNTVYGGRHGFVQGSPISDTEFGVARVARFVANYCVGQWLEAISTHQAADTHIYEANIVDGARGGINPRYAKRIIATGNDLNCRENGFVLYNDLINATFTGNNIEAGVFPIWIKTIDNPTAPVLPDGYSGNATKRSGPTAAGPSFQFNGGQLKGGRNGIYFIDTTPGLTVAGIEINGVSIYGTLEEAIRVSIGNPTVTSLTGFTGAYDNATGLVTLTLGSPQANLVYWVPFTLAGLTGTGAFASLNGAHTSIRPTGGAGAPNTVTFKVSSGLGATTITDGTLTLPLGGWTGSIKNCNFYDCGRNGATNQLRLSNPQGVAVNNNTFFGTSAFSTAFLIEGAGTTACDFMNNKVPATLYSSSLFNYSSLPGTGHRTDSINSEDVTIASGIATIKFITTTQIRVRGEGSASDDLDSIVGMGVNQQVILSNQLDAATVTLKHGSGFELDANADKALTNRLDRMPAMWSLTNTKLIQTGPLMDHA